MPKIGTGTNKVSIDPKAYAARITRAKKIVASMDPATKAKIKDMYPKITKEEVAKQALNTKKVDMKKNTAPRKPTVSRAPSKGVKVPMPKIQGAKPGAKKLMPKDVNAAPGARKLMSKTLTGPDAIKEIQRRTSTAGVKKAEVDAKKATNKKYPGLYKKSK
jgi:predicted flavoprotein YhiN